MRLSRRDFLIKGTALLATLGLGGASRIWANESPSLLSLGESDVESPVLVVVQLNGGNDGLNTVIPYGSGIYYDARPTLRITQNEVLALNHEVGLHPSLSGLHKMYQDGKLAVIQGVGYPKPNHSHFRSMEIWQTAEPEALGRTGWLGKYLETSLCDYRNPLKALQVGGGNQKAFNSDRVGVPVIQTLETYTLLDPKTPAQDRNRIAKAFLDMYSTSYQMDQLAVISQKGKEAYESVDAIQSLTTGYLNKVEYPKTPFARDLQVVVKLLSGGSGTRVFYVQLGGFDDHALEKDQHARLLKELDNCLAAFAADLEVHNLHQRVVTMAFSEFGRRVKENGSGGTDHGTAGPMFVMGDRVKGGLYGSHPNLANLYMGDLNYEVDFRSVYYTMLEDWLKGDAKAVLGKSYEKFKFI